jgi:hypothetical protein
MVVCGYVGNVGTWLRRRKIIIMNNILEELKSLQKKLDTIIEELEGREKYKQERGDF